MAFYPYYPQPLNPYPQTPVQPYQDRLAQLQNNYQQTMPYGQAQIQQPMQQMPQVATGTMTCAVTDGNTRIIWISDAISGEFLTRVVLHELSHAMMFSSGFLKELHRLVPRENWVEVEELIANLIADKARQIFEIAYEIVGNEAIHFVPYLLEQVA